MNLKEKLIELAKNNIVNNDPAHDFLHAFVVMAIVRTFISSGVMNRKICHLEDPFCENRELVTNDYSLDYLMTKLNSSNELYTQTARRIAADRNIFLKSFMEEMKKRFYKNSL